MPLISITYSSVRASPSLKAEIVYVPLTSDFGRASVAMLVARSKLTPSTLTPKPRGYSTSISLAASGSPRWRSWATR